jgi:cell division protein FtsB
LKDISRQLGIETIELGTKRDDMELEVYKTHAALNDTKQELNEIKEQVKELKDQSDYYEERLTGIEYIKYGVFSGKQAEEDNKALQYENKKLKDENEILHSKMNELQKAADYWQLMCKGIQTFKDEKKKQLVEMINNLIHRGRDPLQAVIEDKKKIDNNSFSPVKIKNNSVTEEEYFEREER